MAAHNCQRLAALKLQWPFVLAESPQRGYWEAFRLSAIAAVILTVFLSTVLGEAFYIAELRQQLGASVSSVSRNEIRHLSPDQRTRMRVALQMPPTEAYSFEINSLPNCDECEQLAEEIREFISSIPGWKAGGSTVIFPQPFHQGVHLFARADENHSLPIEKIYKAFSIAGISLICDTYNQMPPGMFTIVVARAGP